MFSFENTSLMIHLCLPNHCQHNWLFPGMFVKKEKKQDSIISINTEHISACKSWLDGLYSATPRNCSSVGTPGRRRRDAHRDSRTDNARNRSGTAISIKQYDYRHAFIAIMLKKQLARHT